jgi:hypothetical protein
MSTLTEIEAAADALSPEQRETLLKYLTERVQDRRRLTEPPSRNLAEFSGSVRLGTDPLVWQTAVRDEWQ